MIRSVNQRIILAGLAPLAILAVALVVGNGFARIQEARRELASARQLTSTLLHAPALDALVIGNTLPFEQVANDVTKSSGDVVCISLADNAQRAIASAGQCDIKTEQQEVVPITTMELGLTDFDRPRAETDRVVGRLRVTMSEGRLRLRIQEVLIQLGFSLLLILTVVVVLVRVLRSRVVTPIQRIGAAMQALSRREYDQKLNVEGNDEVSRLAIDVDKAISTIAGYTKELVRRRDEADRALHDADEANLARDGLVKSLTEELDVPLSAIQGELTTMAIENGASTSGLGRIELQQRIKSVLGTVQDAQSNLQELIEIGTSTLRAGKVISASVTDFLTEIQTSSEALSKNIKLPLHFELSSSLTDELRAATLEIDGHRCKKTVQYILRAMFKRCTSIGAFIHVNVIQVSNKSVNLSIQLKAFFEPSVTQQSISAQRPLINPNIPPVLLGWTDRDSLIIDYLLRESRMTLTYSSSATGSICVNLETQVNLSKEVANIDASDWAFATHPIHTTIVSDDADLLRLTSRAMLSNHEFRVIPFTLASNNIKSLVSADAVVIDTEDDVTSAFGLIEDIKLQLQTRDKQPKLFALCTGGPIDDELESQLFELGFTAVIQKPIQYGRLIEIIHSTNRSPAALKKALQE